MTNFEKENFATYEQALALKELGFSDYCYRGYDKNQMLFYSEQESGHLLNYSVGMNVSAPFKQQVFRWFREKYNCCSILFCDNGDIDYSNHKFYYEIRYMIYSFDSYYEEPNFVIGNHKYNTYEEAESACIDKLIELAKKQKL